MNDQRRNNQSPLGSIITVMVVMAILSGGLGELLILVLTLGLLVGIVAVPVWLFKRRNHRETHQRQIRDTTYSPCEPQRRMDEKMQSLFCRHDDKSIHHVRRGKEIDPWDRPDIDITKYQRKR